MKNLFQPKLSGILLIIVFFSAFFIYFFLFNRYHLSYLEQNQLFRYELSYVTEFFQKPGGFIVLIGAFVTQFFSISWIAALLLTSSGLLLFLISQSIFRFYNFRGILFSLLPVVFLASLHSNHNYRVAFTIGWLFSLACFSYYIRIKQNKLRYLFGFLSLIILYFLAGIFSILTLLLIIIHELLFQNERSRFNYILAIIVVAILIPFLGWRFIFLVDFITVWLAPLSLTVLSSNKLFFLLLAIYYPLIIIAILIVYHNSQQNALRFNWNLKHKAVGILFIFSAIALMLRLAYNPGNELFLKIDASYQAADWDKVLALSKKYPGNNQLVMYYTNLALYKSGRLPDNMFAFKQSGTNGLWIDWKRNVTASFFGGELYYHLGYNNEAYRWAFEAMEAKGLNPRNLKRLIQTSIINHDVDVANKFLQYLDQTLFYRKWANQYQLFLTDSTEIHKNAELLEKRRLLVREDFVSGVGSQQYELLQLLKYQSNNQMAFEYLMMSFLLQKDLESFAANIYRLKELGYHRIPLHFEEALILYNGITRKNVMPEGYAIRVATQKSFHNYARLFASTRHSMDKSAEALYRDFGNTFWYYMQFSNVLSKTNQEIN